MQKVGRQTPTVLSFLSSFYFILHIGIFIICIKNFKISFVTFFLDLCYCVLQKNKNRLSTILVCFQDYIVSNVGPVRCLVVSPSTVTHNI